ncbi:metalloprotease [Auriculariales sp. MPI-PUGE-AT-0066]|nr:metalloprotease [Auriculariales sp. MPI-PUGE-AT-0066]
MRTLSFITSFALATAASAGLVRKCSTTFTVDDVAARQADYEREIRAQSSARAKISLFSTVVPVYFHVIIGEGGAGNLTDEAVHSQIDVINKAYKKTGVSFSLVEINRRQNASWYNIVEDTDKRQIEMKTALRKGGREAMNVYTISLGYDDGTGGLLGYATLPQDYKAGPNGTHFDDGVVILYASLPGGSAAPYNLGHTLTHEAGHWVGLYHTFEGGCSEDAINGGDQVFDTAAEGAPTFDCPPKGQEPDSCKKLPGKDNVHNYLNYAIDSCMTEFTFGQAIRMQAMLRIYRHLGFPFPSLP